MPGQKDFRSGGGSGIALDLKSRFLRAEFMNPLVELRNTSNVFSAAVHTVIMAEILNLASSSAKKNRLG